MKKNTFQSGASLIDGYLKKLCGDDQGLLAIIKEEWPETVGQKVSEHAQPVGLSNGILIVEVKNPVWRRELQMTAGKVVQEAVKKRYRQIKRIAWR